MQGCFPKKNRLLISSDFQRVFKQGRKQKGALFAFFCCANGKINARLGLAIAKRHIPRAVERNRVRRVIRESFRNHQVALRGNDVVVVMQRQIPELSNTTLREDLNLLWQNLINSLQVSSSQGSMRTNGY